MSPVQQQSVRLTNWLTKFALPLWSKAGVDPVTGVHYEHLFVSGEANRQCDRRVRVQARQSFVFAAAQEKGWFQSGDVASKMLDFLLENGRHPQRNGGYIRTFNLDGLQSDTAQDLYDHAFIFLAIAWVYRVTKNPTLLQQANELLIYLNHEFRSDVGGWKEGDYVTDCRRQNPHMHLFEAFLAMYETTLDKKWLFEVDAIFVLFNDKFYQKSNQVVLEFFDEEWAPKSEGAGFPIEPGHSMEWVWLLDWYQQYTDQPLSPIIEGLFATGCRIGVSPSGLLYDVILANGEVLSENKRCWGITEYIKACVVMARKGHQEAEVRLIEAVDNLFSYYLTTNVTGTYVEHRGPNNEDLTEYVPATTLYHITMAAVVLDEYSFSTKP